MSAAGDRAGDVLVDANLLLVLVTGAVDRFAVGRSKRTTAYTPALWDLLVTHVGQYRRVVVTPNVLTEVSNLSAFGDERFGERIRQRLAELVQVWDEVVVESAAAMRRPEFVRLGLSDAVMLTVAARRVTVLTSDLPLYVALANIGAPVVNFWHLAEAARLVE